ncbi:MAG: hypothetical protein J6386_13940 [Candidatus Synoicihabitans palmerolidicus]|nr:hypothetical protein [Candidatus Synoicihabitans palmerolidicus]
MPDVIHLKRDQLEAALPQGEEAPNDGGKLEMIVRRPVTDERELMQQAELSVDVGLVGDNWVQGKANPQCQLTLMNSRAAQLVAQDRTRWALAGDQLYVDMNIGRENLPAGTQVAIGSEVVIEVTPEPHTGCAKFIARFGCDEVCEFACRARAESARN